METFNFIRPDFSQKNAEVEEYLRRLLNELDHISFNNSVHETEKEIEEEGTDGIWTYRKWTSGIAECWGSKEYTVSGFYTGHLVDPDWRASTSRYRTNYPDELFAGNPVHQVTLDQQQEGGVYPVMITSVEKGTSSKTPSYNILCRDGDIGQISTVRFNYYARGRWK